MNNALKMHCSYNICTHEIEVFYFLSWSLIMKLLSKYSTSECLYCPLFLNPLYTSKSKKGEINESSTFFFYPLPQFLMVTKVKHNLLFPKTVQMIFLFRLLNLFPQCTSSLNYQVTFQTWYTYLYLERRNQWEKILTPKYKWNVIQWLVYTTTYAFLE